MSVVGAAAGVIGMPEVDLEAGGGALTPAQENLQHLDELADRMEERHFCGLLSEHDLAKWERGTRTVTVVILVAGAVFAVIGGNWWLLGGSIGAGILAGPTLYRAYEFSDLLGILTHIGAIRATGRELEGQVNELGVEIEKFKAVGVKFLNQTNKLGDQVSRLKTARELLVKEIQRLPSVIESMESAAAHLDAGSEEHQTVSKALADAQARIIVLEGLLKAADE